MREPRDRPGEIALVEGSVPPGVGLMELIAESDVVFYMAGTSTPESANLDPGASIANHIVPAAAVLDLMCDTPTRRIVVASSGGTVYGAATEFPTPEDHPTRPISLHGHHSLTIERYARFFAERHGFEPVILRYSNPYGPGQLARRGQGVIAAWSQALARGEPLRIFGDPATRRDFIYIDDLVSATVDAGLIAPADTYNVGSGEASSLEEVIELLTSAAGLEGAQVVRVGERGVDVPMTQLECGRLSGVIDWTPRVALPEGIRASLDWMRELPYRRGN